MKLKGRKTDKERRTIPVRFSTDPKKAKDQRAKLDTLWKRSGYASRNEYILRRLGVWQ